MEPNTEGTSVAGKEETVTDASPHFGRGSNTKIEKPLIQRKLLLLVSLVLGAIRLSAQYSHKITSECDSRK